nr:MAG TPA: hypothetical protein [Caudoviricetes sp.]
MAYSGFLIRTGDYEIPLEYISCQTYKVTRSIQDLNSYRDSNGELHREALEHTLEKVEFETVPKLYGNEMGKLIKGISDNYIIAGERKVLATVFIPEINDYVTREMYVPDIQFAIDDATQTDIRYGSSKITFIAY